MKFRIGLPVQADLAVQRLDDLGRRRALWFVQDRQVLRREGGVLGQVRVTEVRALDVSVVIVALA
jgi:hypothetical protein